MYGTNGVVLTLDEQLVGLYWCVPEFEAIIRVRLLWGRECMSPWFVQILFNGDRARLSIYACSLNVWTVTPDEKLVRFYFCVLEFEDVIRVRYSMKSWMSPWCAVQLHYKRLYVYVRWMYGMVPCWPWTTRRWVCIGVCLNLKQLLLVSDAIWGRNVIPCSNTLQWRWRLFVYLCSLNVWHGRCRVDPDDQEVRVCSVYDVCLNLKLLLVLMLCDIVISPWCVVQIHNNDDGDCVFVLLEYMTWYRVGPGRTGGAFVFVCAWLSRNKLLFAFRWTVGSILICPRCAFQIHYNGDCGCSFVVVVECMEPCLVDPGQTESTFVLVCPWIWSRYLSSMQYDSYKVVNRTLMYYCPNTLQWRWRAAVRLCSLNVWNGVGVVLAAPWTNRRCVCTGVCWNLNLLFVFDAVVCMRSSFHPDVLPKQIHYNGDDDCAFMFIECV